MRGGGHNLLFNGVALRWRPLPPRPSPTLSAQISASPACQEQKLAFVINQFDRAVTEQSLPATGSSTPSTFSSAENARCSAADGEEEETRKWSANGVGLVDKSMSVTLQSTEMRRLEVRRGVKRDPRAYLRQRMRERLTCDACCCCCYYRCSRAGKSNTPTPRQARRSAQTPLWSTAAQTRAAILSSQQSGVRGAHLIFVESGSCLIALHKYSI